MNKSHPKIQKLDHTYYTPPSKRFRFLPKVFPPSQEIYGHMAELAQVGLPQVSEAVACMATWSVVAQMGCLVDPNRIEFNPNLMQLSCF